MEHCYTPGQRRGLGLGQLAASCLGSRTLVAELLKKDLVGAYKKTALGLAWVVLSPLFAVGAWALMNAAGILVPGDIGIPFPAYVLVGTLYWGLFRTALLAAGDTLADGRDFILQIRYPHGAILFKQLARTVVLFAPALILNLGVLVALGVTPHAATLLVPLAAVPLLLLAAGLGLILALAKALFTDVQRVAELALDVGLFVTPILYAPDVREPWLAALVRANPLAALVGALRDLTLRGEPPGAAYGAWAALSALFFLIAWRIFFLTEERVVERML